MKTSLLIALGLMPVMALAGDPLPKRPDFSHYQALLGRSPFSIATFVPTTTTPDFSRDLYVASVVCSEEGAVVTLESSTDKNFKQYLSTKGPSEHGYRISDIQWSEQMRQTKVTITKDCK